MSAAWQNTIVYFLVAWAAAYILRVLWRLGRMLRGGGSGNQPGCGNCGSCGSAPSKQSIIVDLTIPSQATVLSPEKTSGGL